MITELRVVGALALALGLVSIFAPYRWHDIPPAVANSGLAAAAGCGLWAIWIALPVRAKNWFKCARYKLLGVFGLTLAVGFGTILRHEDTRDDATDLETPIMLLVKTDDLKKSCNLLTPPFRTSLNIVTDGSPESKTFVGTFASLLPEKATTVWEPLPDERISRGIELRVKQPLNPSLEAVQWVDCFHKINLPLPVHELSGEERLRATIELFVGLRGQAKIMSSNNP